MYIDNVVLSSLCYHYGISQTYVKMQLIYSCKRENGIYLTKLSDKNALMVFLGVIINKEIKLFLLITSKLAKMTYAKMVAQ